MSLWKLLLSACFLLTSVSGLGFDAVGILTPSSELGVESSYTNVNEVADYQFGFIPETTIPVGGLLVVTFPLQYLDGLGISGSPSCTGGSCTLSGRTVTITVSGALSAGVAQSVTITGVTNPAFDGGTGPFSLSSYKGDTLLDQNLTFGVIGIASAVSVLTFASVITTSGSSGRVGDASRLDFFFKTGAGIEPGSWLRFTFPTSPAFILAGQPTCVAVAVRGVQLQGNLQCELSGHKVTLTGITEALPAGNDATIRISVTNPPQAGLAGPFTIETGVSGTNTVIERARNIIGVQIAPGQITGISLVPADSQMIQSTNRLVPYLVTFTLTNPVPAGGSIRIRFSADFNPNGSLNGAYIVSGLSDPSGGTATMSYTAGTYTVAITGFAAYTTKTAIQIWIPVVTPTRAGSTWPLVLTSAMATGTTIDQDEQTAVTTITDVTSMALVTGAGSYVAAQAMSFQVKITPNKAIPAEGYVKIRLPEGFSMSTALPTCTCTPYGIGTSAAKSCVYTNGIITVQLFLVGTVGPIGPGNLPASNQSYVTISTGLVASQISGTYYFDVTSYDTSSNLLETGSLVVSLTAAAFTAMSVDSAHKELDTPTVLKWLFTPLIDIPSGVTSGQQNSYGRIEVVLPTMTTVGSNNLYRTDLGLGITVGGVVPCLGISGIQPPTGTFLSCTITTLPASAGVGNTVYITVTNFQSITSGTIVGLHLSGLKHVQTANNPTMTFTTYKVSNRVRTNLNTWSGTLTTAPAASGAAVTDSVNSFTSTSQLIATPSTLSFTIKTVLGLAAVNSAFLLRITPNHDTGYCLSVVSSQFVCTVNGAVYSCICYPNSDLILISIGAVGFTAGNSYPVTIKNIYNPPSVAGSNDGMVIYTIDNLGVKNTITYTNLLPAQTSGPMARATVTPTQYGTGFVGVTYELVVMPTHSVPQGGSLGVVFPAIFSLTGSVPVPQCTTRNLTPVSGLSILCSLSPSIVTITNFSSISLTSPTTILITGLKNPSSAGASGIFYFTTRTAAGLVIDNDNYPGFTFNTGFVAGAATPSVYMIPTNAGLSAEYVVALNPSATIPAGGTISITFPSQFGSISSPFTCRVSSPFTTLQACSLSGSTFTVTLDTALTGTSIILSLIGIVNPGVGTTGSFMSRCDYDSVILDQSPTNAMNSVTTTAIATSLAVSSIDFTPQNEGEPAAYTFSFTPEYSFQSSDYIVVKFPEEYDAHVGVSLSCSATGLVGSLICTVTTAREVRVSGFQAFTPCGACSIVLTISGVVNPRATSTTGFFSLGILSGSAYLQFNSAVGPLEITSAPSRLDLTWFSIDNLSSRYPSVMSFNITTKKTLPSTTNQGAMWIVYPSQYLLTNSQVNCNSTTWPTALNCTVDRDTVKINGQDSDRLGQIQVLLDNVPNPMLEGTADTIILKTINEHSKSVLERTYANLNPKQLQFAFAGPLIKVNNDQEITLYSGTFSKEIVISVDFPCALNLTFTPDVEDFVVNPKEIRLNVGEMKTSFTIAAPIAITKLKTVMLWKTVGDVSPAYYTPLQKTILNLILSHTDIAYVTCQTPPPVPISGHSLPFSLTLSLAPVNDLTVDLSLSASLNGASLAENSVVFKAGEWKKFGEILAVGGGVPGTGTMSVSVSGTDMGLYTVKTSSVEITIVDPASTLPLISSLSVLSTTKTTANIAVTTNSPGTLYYMYAYFGTQTPPFIEVRYGGPPPYDKTRSIYGNLNVTETNYGTFGIDYLRAGRKYQLFAYFVDLLDEQTEECKVITITTPPLSPASTFSLRFTQSFLNAFEISRTITIINLLTSTTPWQLSTISTDSPGLSGRRLSDSLTTVLTLAISDNPFNDNYPSPSDLVVRLAGKMQVLTGRLNNLDTTYAITGTEVSMKDCEFLSGPESVKITSKPYANLGFSASLKEQGYIYAVCVLTTVTSGTPLGWQVAEGMSAENIPVPAEVKRVQKEEVWNYTFTNLLPGSPFVLYITCGNDYPVFPTLPPDSSLTGLFQQTADTPAPKILSLNLSTPLRLTLILLLLLAN